MDRLDIKIQLLRKGTSVHKIGMKLGVSPQAVYMVIKGDSTSKRIAAEIEKVLGMPIEEVQKAYRKRYKPPVTAA